MSSDNRIKSSPDGSLLSDSGGQQLDAGHKNDSYRQVFRTLGTVALTIAIASPLAALMVVSNYQYIYGGFWGLTWGGFIPTIILFPQLRPEWSPSTGQLVGIGYGLQLVWLLLVSLRMERFHAANLIIDNFSDWDRSAAVPLTFLIFAFTVGGWTASVYVVEETHDGSRSVPKAMVSSYILTSALGFILCIITAFCTIDIVALALDPSGYPVYTLISDHFGVRGGGAYLLMSVIFTSMGGCSTLLTTSSQLASFARDGGLPFSKTFAYIHPSTNMPIPAALLLTLGGMLILLFAFSSEAATIIYSLAVIATLLLWLVPITLRVFAGRRFVPGPFSLGRWSVPVHAYSAAATVFLMVMESFPSSKAWTAETFNYKWVVAVGVLALCLGFWFTALSKNLEGPGASP
ncbi:amino acid permease-domain-containing protein [Aspergillus venezuelensis]